MRKMNSSLIVLIVVALLLVSAIGAIIYYNGLSSKSSPTATLTPSPAESTVTLIPNNQIIQVNVTYGVIQPTFNVTIRDNSGSNLQFPCHIALTTSKDPTYTNPPQLTVQNFGSYKIGYDYENTYHNWAAGTTSFYAVVLDSNGKEIISNTVTVQFV